MTPTKPPNERDKQQQHATVKDVNSQTSGAPICTEPPAPLSSQQTFSLGEGVIFLAKSNHPQYPQACVNRADKSTLTRGEKQKAGRMPACPVGSWPPPREGKRRPVARRSLTQSLARSCDDMSLKWTV